MLALVRHHNLKVAALQLLSELHLREVLFKESAEWMFGSSVFWVVSVSR